LTFIDLLCHGDAIALVMLVCCFAARASLIANMTGVASLLVVVPSDVVQSAWSRLAGVL